MGKLFYLIISIWFCLGSTILSQNPEWINYTNGQTVQCLALQGDYVWAGTIGGLVKLNKTTGESTFYNKANSGLPDIEVTSFAIDGNGNKWIGTWEGGLAVYKEGGVVSVEENQIREIVPEDYLLHQNYPNPFNPSTTIQYSIPQNADSRFNLSNVQLKVYDILGREVATLVNEKQKPGNYEIEWNAKNIPCGVYFYKIRAGEFVETKKMILLH